MFGFKIDNCITEENLKYLDSLLYICDEKTPLEIGLECYDTKRYINLDSEILTTVFEYFKSRTNNIVHMTLEAKLLNKNKYTEYEWFKIWEKQFKRINKENINYIVLHATSEESKILEEQEQIDIICKNYEYVKKMSKFPIYIENTYEDINFYQNLFKSIDISANFTFDIGHKKIHSTAHNMKWIDFCDSLLYENRNLHFHIHDNEGFKDKHKPVSFYKDKKTIDFIQVLKNKYKFSNFILENHSSNFDDIIKEYIYIQSNIYIN